jgi:hypothetical protein
MPRLPLLRLLLPLARLSVEPPAGATSAAAETLNCAVVIAGGSAASLSAALTAAAAAPSAVVCLTDPTDWLGGQLTASAVSAIDGPMLDVTGRSGHALLAALGSPRNPGGCWVSTMCFEPAHAVRDYIAPAVARLPNLVVLNRTVVVRTERCSEGGGSKRICALHAVQRVPKGGAAAREWSRLLSASLGDWYSPSASELFTKRLLRITGDVFLEATEFGDVLATGAAEPGLELPFVQGIEEPREDSRSTDDQCGQAATLTFFTRIADATEPPVSPPVPAGSEGDGTPFDIPNDGNQRPLPTPWQWDDVFTYRRARRGSATPPGSRSAAAHGGQVYVGDLSQQNWGGGNDLEGAYLWLPAKDALVSAREGRWAGGVNTTALSMLEQRAYGWFHYYSSQSRASNSSAALRAGTAKLVLDRAAAGTEHGLAKMPYLRDTRRSVGLGGFRLQYEALANAANSSSHYGVRFADTVAIGSYAHDTHGLSTCSIPPYVTDAPPSKPYYIPFRALTSDGADNLLVAGKTMAASFSANSATRLHPEEWSTGVAAGAAAALLVTNPDLNASTRQLFLRGLPELTSLLQSPAIAQPLDWERPVPSPSRLTWECELERCVGVGSGGGGNSTTCGGRCGSLAADEWLANLDYWTATSRSLLLVAKQDTELKKSTTQSDSLPAALKRAVKKGQTCRQESEGAYQGYAVCTLPSAPHRIDPVHK